MAGSILVARKTAALVFGGRTVYIEQGVTLAREGHPILDAAGEMFEPVNVHFEVSEPPTTVTEDEPPANPQSTAPPAAEVPPPAEPAAADQPAPKDVRAWAAEQGIEVPARGKLPDTLVEQYQAAQGA